MEESVFSAVGVLDSDYLPKLMPFREDHQKYVASCMEKLPYMSRNLLIQGPSGIGKTACIKWVFREFRESSDKEFPLIYINCWESGTTESVLRSIANNIGINATGRSVAELMDSVLGKLNAYGACVFCLDEADRLKDQEILYLLLERISHKLVIMITTSRGWTSSIDHRIYSRLVPERIEFRPYDREQTRKIMMERVSYAFRPGAFTIEALEIVVAKCFARGDMRYGLALLKASGIAADDADSDSITPDHVSSALMKMGESQ